MTKCDAQEQGRTFAPAPAVGSAKSEVAKTFAKGLIQGAGSQIGGRATGWVLDRDFGGSGEPDYPADPAVLNGIRENGQEIHQLRQDLENLEADMHQRFIQILSQAEQNEYTILVGTLEDEIVKTQRLQETLWLISNHDGDSDDSDWKAEVKRFRDDLDVERA
ncbi:MAG: hypothetical protein U5J98_00355 [Halobacteriales archaeon]|nr:hypothetical protein [Halobacteriales archaeon]